MRLLLDTHIWLWSLLQRERIGPGLLQKLEEPSSEVWLSPISIWELVVLCQKGRIKLDEDVDQWVAHKLRVVPFREAPITHAVALATLRVTLPHRDPADRFLVATAQVFDLTLVTADEEILKLKDVALLANR